MAARVQSVLEIAHVGILFRVDPRVREENRQVADEELHLCCLSSEIHAAATTSPPPPPRAKLIRISLVLDPQTLLATGVGGIKMLDSRCFRKLCLRLVKMKLLLVLLVV